ncbi:hypothetical protein Pan44_14640 [Caulifigura coniformis]|uniref:DUF1559 domain-containing protein n=1 Tax=Caulifigura coniformis TaxID=2527983 RepID=A0A517SBC8_9PLAN|nr:DUF1559 domain-containing protein [Caulifigura coniformis]QDT53447.1 hypothetical protein Pan44_14640 [Caulifigura coniformis]
MKALAFDSPDPWRFYLVHSGLLLFTVGAILALLIRSRRPSGPWDVVAWALLIPIAVVIGRYLEFDAHTAPFAYGLAGFLLLIGVSGTIVSSLRWLRKSTSPQTGLAFGMLAGLAFLTNCMIPVTPARTAARRTQCKNNLKQIGLALHNFADEHDGLPEPIVATDPPRSWRVEVLPYLDEHALRKSYRDDATWDSDANLEPGRHGRIYMCPSMADPYDSRKRTLTCYTAVTGENSAFSPENRVRFPNLPDGDSNTILVIEAGGRGITWTDPRDSDLTTQPIRINAAGATPTESPAIGSSPHTGGCHVTLADGSVRFISENINSELLKKLLTADGGESIENEEF